MQLFNLVYDTASRLMLRVTQLLHRDLSWEASSTIRFIWSWPWNPWSHPVKKIKRMYGKLKIVPFQQTALFLDYILCFSSVWSPRSYVTISDRIFSWWGPGRSCDAYLFAWFVQKLYGFTCFQHDPEDCNPDVCRSEKQFHHLQYTERSPKPPPERVREWVRERVKEREMKTERERGREGEGEQEGVEVREGHALKHVPLEPPPPLALPGLPVRTSREYYELSHELSTFIFLSWVEFSTFVTLVLNSTHDKQRCTHQT